MTHSRSALVLVLALVAVLVVAAPAGASGTYRSLNSIVGSGSRGGPSTVVDDPSSPAAILGTQGVPSHIGTPASSTSADDGFDWFDALVGAMAGASLVLLTLAAGRPLARRRRTATPQHA